MTATRMGRGATLAAAAALWAFLASLLWRTKAPHALRLPHLSPGLLLGPHALRSAERYERLLDLLWVAGTLATLAALVAMVVRAPRLARRIGLGRVNTGIVVGVVTLAVVWAASLPFAVTAAWWERRHGILLQSYGAILASSWGALLGNVLATFVLLAVALGLAQRLGGRWWLAAAPLVVGLAVLVQLLAPYLLSIGTKPLRAEPLAGEVRALEQREGADRSGVRVDPVHDRTTSANAFSVGLGPSRRVIFWDTLLDGRFTRGEVRFVAAHELAHVARNHILKGLAWFALIAIPILAAVAFVTGRRGGLRNPATVPLALLTIAAAQLALLPLTNALSRRYESEADWVALGATRDPGAARGLFAGFSRTSLQDPTSPGWAHVLLDDHPTPLQRVEMAAAWKARNR